VGKSGGKGEERRFSAVAQESEDNETRKKFQAKGSGRQPEKPTHDFLNELLQNTKSKTGGLPFLSKRDARKKHFKPHKGAQGNPNMMSRPQQQPKRMADDKQQVEQTDKMSILMQNFLKKSKEPPSPQSTAIKSQPLAEYMKALQVSRERKAAEAAAAPKPEPKPKRVFKPMTEWPDLHKIREASINRRQNRYGAKGNKNDRSKQTVMQLKTRRRPRPIRKKRTTFKNRNLKEKMITLPAYGLNLQEASMLFRAKSDELRSIVQSLDLMTISNDQDPTDIMMNPECMELVALELGQAFKRSEAKDDDETNLRAVAIDDTLPSRPPVVTVMGHVDHGKTTLMDALRRRAAGPEVKSQKKKKKAKNKSKQQKTEGGDVAGTEAGGITQAISAFQVSSILDDATVTFLDTPGHAAFKSMRQSGSEAADVIVLVVAADDGVSPQTVEIIDCYKSILEDAEGSISMVVAMNKIDKPGIDVVESQRRIESQLLEHGILAEGMPDCTDGIYGPPVQLFPISALTNEGIDDLVEGLSLQAEVMDLRADAEALGEGVIMDSRMEKGLGIVVDCIVRWGSMKKGDLIVSGSKRGRIKMLKDEKNAQVKSASPSQPVRIIGFDTLPAAGDPIVCVGSEAEVDDLIARREAVAEADDAQNTELTNTRQVELQSSGKDMMNFEWRNKLANKYEMDDGGTSTVRIPVVVKADADGTLEALKDALVRVGQESTHDILIEPIKAEVGPALSSDVQLSKESGACLVCFNVKCDLMVSRLATEENVPLMQSDIIYSLIDDAKEEFAKALPMIETEVVYGKAEVKTTFSIGGIETPVAGVIVTDGKLHKVNVNGSNETATFRVLRNGKIINANAMASSLKHFKDDVDEVGRGQECGLALHDHDEYREGDIIECFGIEKRHQVI